MTATASATSSAKPATRQAKTPGISVFSAGGTRMATIRVTPAGRAFQKNVDGSKHFLRVPPSIALDADVHDDHAEQFDFLEITDRETGDVWTISRVDFDTYRTMIDRKFGRQYAVLFAYWSKNSQPARGVPMVGKPAPVAPVPPAQQSLGLFD